MNTAEQDRVKEFLNCAQRARDRGDRAAALAAFEAAAALCPLHAGIRVEMACELRSLARLDDAEAILRGVLDAEPQNFGALAESGHIRCRRGDHAGAVAEYEAAAAQKPRHPGINFELARALRVMDRLAEAETYLRRVLEADPCSAAALVECAQINLCRGDRAAALGCLRSAAEAAPANLDVRLELAAELREQGTIDEALVLVRSVLDVDADHFAALMQLGQLHRSRDDRPQAMAAFQAAAAKHPHRTQALVELVHENWAAGAPEEADQLLQRALAQEPNHLGALMVAAEHALLAEDAEKALALARCAIEQHAGQLGPYLIAARAAAASLDRTEALRLLDRARAAFGQKPEIAATRIHVLRQYRDHDTVRVVISQGTEQAETNFGYFMECTSFAITLGDFDAADQALEAAPATSRQEMAQFHVLRAQLAEARRLYRQAIACYQEALALDPGNGDWHSDLARACLLVANTEAAREQLRAYFKLNGAAHRARGQSLNVSQHHIGQLLDEFSFDTEVLERLKRIAKLQAGLQIEPLRQLVRHNPDHTAPAILLMLAMRRARLFATGRDDPAIGAAGIPRRIIQYWDAETPPPDVRELMQSWGALNGNFAHVRFDDAAALRFLRARCADDVVRAFRRAHQPAQRVDIFRLAYLAHDGGFFVDADDRCLAPIDTLVPANATFAAYQESYGTLGTNFIGAPSNHPVILRALKLATAALNRGDRDIAWLSTGPGLLTRAFAQRVAEAGAEECMPRTVVLELHELQRAVGVFCPARYKRTGI